MNLSTQMMETIGCYKIIFPATKTFFSVFTQMCFQKFIAQPKKEVSTSKVIFTLYLKPKRTKNSWKVQWGKTQEIMSL